MSSDAPAVAPAGEEAAFTGERFLPQCSGEIAYEHWHRYAFARSFAGGKAILDVASGEGYGAALLAEVAAHVHGVDIDAETLRQASRKYAPCANLRFVRASCTALPFADRSFDLIVSFETIEHIDGESQVRMLEEFDRLLEPEGMLILSSPNKAEYSDARQTRNEFHLRELYRDELAQLLARGFPATRWFSQRIQCWSGIWSESAAPTPVEALSMDDVSVRPYGAPPAMYYVVLAARSDAALAAPLPRGSLLTDRDDSVLRRYEAAVGQLVHHYKLVDELSAACDRQAEHVLHLERLVLERERLLEHQATRASELEAALAQQSAASESARERYDVLRTEIERLQTAAVDDQMTIESLRERVQRLADALRGTESWRWWLRFPLSRTRGERPPW
ncbi:MAG TPA: class I SAM-dependent methyltransferase [Casimicrobiaceae bacterium]